MAEYDAHGPPPDAGLPPNLRAAAESMLRWNRANLEANQRANIDEPLFHVTTIAGAIGMLRTDEMWFTSIFQMNDKDELAFPETILKRVMRAAAARPLGMRATYEHFEKFAKR